MALRSTQPLREMTTTNISYGGRGKAGRCVQLTTLPFSGADGLEIWEPQPPGTLRAYNGPVQGVLYLYLRRRVSRNAGDV